MATDTSMLHVRIDNELKNQAAENLAKFGLTVGCCEDFVDPSREGRRPSSWFHKRPGRL
jgi:hypothetical protein